MGSPVLAYLRCIRFELEHQDQLQGIPSSCFQIYFILSLRRDRDTKFKLNQTEPHKDSRNHGESFETNVSLFRKSSNAEQQRRKANGGRSDYFSIHNIFLAKARLSIDQNILWNYSHQYSSKIGQCSILFYSPKTFGRTRTFETARTQRFFRRLKDFQSRHEDSKILCIEDFPKNENF